MPVSLKDRVRVWSNFRRMGDAADDVGGLDHFYVGPFEGELSSLRLARRSLAEADYLILNIDMRRLLVACALFWIVARRPGRRCKLVSVDILLRPPKSPAGRIGAMIRRFLLKQVDVFILYFRNIDGYNSWFGIPRDRTVYVPFKVNGWERLQKLAGAPGTGDYVLLAGATLRDHATFVEAVRRTGVPAVILIPGADRAAVERSAWFNSNLPSNLRVEYHDDGREETYISYFEGARVLCLPRFRWDIASTGISGYLCAMALAKCVLISRGPGAEDVLAESESAVFFTPEDPADLAHAMKELWEDEELRTRIAGNGQRYAAELQGESRLLRDILIASGVSGEPSPVG